MNGIGGIIEMEQGDLGQYFHLRPTRRIVFHIEIKHLQHPHQQPWTTPKEGSLINWILMSISRGQKIL